ncbi:MAG: adenosylcobinamide kinase/ Adenosylcobinamide-phosphate guanylyltransferase [Nitrospira sp.]|jgi:adenosylcobinamide kinase/adenosylcobinamide-phosphate guanylyltransferase|nr:MAG: adenosylcobinamide kinase/ Adenosylcobinamide-phosphate guanylyltransferase [Nitrospira sp.]
MKKKANKRSRLVLVLGGASSGKSQAALELAGRSGPKAFVATGEALDGEMADRIKRHRATRSAEWVTAEVPRELAAWFRSEGKAYRTIVVDCLTLWLSNLCGRRITDKDITEPVDDLLQAIRAVPARVVLVSNELGFGLVPANRSARAFRDLAGGVNQQVADAADEVYVVISGQSLKLK